MLASDTIIQHNPFIIMSCLRPTFAIGSVVEINPEALREEYPDIGAITFDLDKTLTGQHDSTIPDEHLETLQGLAEAHFELGFISNATSNERARRVHTIARRTGGIVGEEIIVVTSLELGGTRKPSGEPFELMARKMSRRPHQLGYVGDQIFKDILGANRAGYGLSVLVAPFGEGDDPRVKYLQRPVEALARLGMGLPFRAKSFGKQS